ncbi:DoxX family protein [Microbacterium gilvum]|uniref:DoxX family protein n=1 Tax=Microbacterium gilvum TaxID=1336204 RepID=A0ABP8ZX41_9MICO
MPPLTQRFPLAGDLGLLVLRIALGVVMIAHGAQKLFAFTLAGTTESFEAMGMPLASVTAPLAIAIELLGGAAILLGAAAPVAGGLIAAQMLVATALVHMPYGVFVADGGWELTALLGASALAVALVGAGRFSLDAVIAARRTPAAAAA